MRYDLQFRRSILRNAGFIWLEERLPELFDWVSLYLVDDAFRWQELNILTQDDIVEILATLKARVDFSMWKKSNQYVSDNFLDSVGMSDGVKQTLIANMQYWQPLQIMR